MMQNKIKRLEAEIKEANKANTSPQSYTTTVTPDNPAYIQLQAQLEAVKSELKSQKRKKRKLENKLTLHEGRLMNSPQVEREYRELTRDYENAQVKYREVRAKEMEAQMSESLETERKGERFTLIEPPQLPEKPIKPNRLAIMFLGFVFAIGGGLGIVVVRDSLSDTIKGIKDIEQLTNIKPLAGISFIEDNTDNEQAMHRGYKHAFVGAAVLVCIVSVLLLAHFFYKPLDVTWYVLLRKFGL